MRPVRLPPTPNPSPQGGGERAAATLVQEPSIGGLGMADATPPLPLAGRGRGGGHAGSKPSRATTSSLQAARARKMRLEMTEPERWLWRAIKTRVPLEGTHFRRQAPVDRYIVDFCSFGAKLIIEVDGNQHGEDAVLAYDAARTARLHALGYRVLRFSNRDVMTNLESVLDTIYAAVAEPS